MVGPLTMTVSGNKYLLKSQDNLTKFGKGIPLPNQEVATIAKEFTTKIVLEYGISEIILTDQEKSFLSDLFKNICKLLQIKKVQTTAYHSESNGTISSNTGGIFTLLYQ